jgi:alpha-ketoglutarate-dependent taurine dioxygenase
VAKSLTSLPPRNVSMRTLCQPGDVLVIDNWRALHGRGSVASNETRVVERAYLKELI